VYAPESVAVSSFYIRKSRKKNDLANQVEGKIQGNIPIILVDDIINNGNTVRKQIKILEEMGHKVSAIFTCLRFRDLFQYQDLLDKGISIVSIFELNDFSEVLPVKNITPPSDAIVLKKYITEYKLTLTKKPNLYVVAPKSAPILCGEYIYMGVDDGTFHCVRTSDGSTEWIYKIFFGTRGKNIFSSPQIYKDKVIFGAYDGNLYCLNRFTGKCEWLFSEAEWIGSSPAIDAGRGTMYIGLEFGLFKKRGGVAALDINTGKVKWRNYGMTGLTHATPLYNKRYNMVICGCNDNFVYAFNAKNGEIIWKFETKAELKYGATFDDKRGLVIIAGLDGGVYVLKIKDGTLYHRFEARFGFYSTPVLFGDLIIIGSLDKFVYCYNIATKKIQWSFETSGRVFASPYLDKESVLIGTNDGKLYELNAMSGKLVGSIQFTERIVNKIQVEYDTYGQRILYVPTHVGELYKIRG
jgi:outer membrane protein assembly factor BamB